MASDLKRAWLLLALTLGVANHVCAEVTYTYTGLNFTNSSATWHIPRDVPPGYEDEVAAGIAASLLNSKLSISITLPVYLPTGENYFDFYDISSPGLIDAFTTLKNTHTLDDPAIQWSMWSGGSFSGAVGLEGPLSFSGFFRAALQVDGNHQIVAWDIASLDWNFDNQLTLAGSNNGDFMSYHLEPGPYGASDYSASNTTAGSWSVSGSAVTAVPEPATFAMLLGGLGMLGLAARRRAWAATRGTQHARRNLAA